MFEDIAEKHSAKIEVETENAKAGMKYIAEVCDHVHELVASNLGIETTSVHYKEIIYSQIGERIRLLQYLSRSKGLHSIGTGKISDGQIREARQRLEVQLGWVEITDNAQVDVTQIGYAVLDGYFAAINQKSVLERWNEYRKTRETTLTDLENKI